MTAFLASIGDDTWVLPALLIIPLVGALLIWGRGAMKSVATGDEVVSGEAAGPRLVALLTFAVEFIVSLGLWWSFDPSKSGWQHTVDWTWIPSWGIRFTLGVDGIAVMMILLTTFIMLLAVGGSWTSIHTRAHGYYSL